MIKRFITLIIGTVVGAVLGFLIADAMHFGWFSYKWQMIEKPPGNVQLLAALSSDSLWVQDDSGTYYYNEASLTCKSNCWLEVPKIPSLPIVEPYEDKVTNKNCAPSPPLFRVVSRISECRKQMWVDRNFIFALRDDGSIYLWQANIYGEWAAVLLFIGICFGAITLFILTLIVIIINWLTHRANKGSIEKISNAA